MITAPGKRGASPARTERRPGLTVPHGNFPLPSLPRRNPMEAGNGERGLRIDGTTLAAVKYYMPKTNQLAERKGGIPCLLKAVRPLPAAPPHEHSTAKVI
jgi:hypothetical protein